jgi:ligand-binding sensor domain-containing protein
VNYAKLVSDASKPKIENTLTTKAAISINDTLCVLGSISSLVSLNTKTEQIAVFRNFDHRVTALLKYNDSLVYVGSNDGIFKYNIIKQRKIPVNKNNFLWQERIMSLCMSKDGLIWAATACNGIFIINQDSIIAHLTIKNGLPTNSLRCVAYGQQNK